MKSMLQQERLFEGNQYNPFPWRNRSKETMINICCSIIANGDYDLSDDTNYLEKYKIEITDYN